MRVRGSCFFYGLPKLLTITTYIHQTYSQLTNTNTNSLTSTHSHQPLLLLYLACATQRVCDVGVRCSRGAALHQKALCARCWRSAHGNGVTAACCWEAGGFVLWTWQQLLRTNSLTPTHTQLNSHQFTSHKPKKLISTFRSPTCFARLIASTYIEYSYYCMTRHHLDTHTNPFASRHASSIIYQSFTIRFPLSDAKESLICGQSGSLILKIGWRFWRPWLFPSPFYLHLTKVKGLKALKSCILTACALAELFGAWTVVPLGKIWGPHPRNKEP